MSHTHCVKFYIAIQVIISQYIMKTGIGELFQNLLALLLSFMKLIYYLSYDFKILTKL